MSIPLNLPNLLSLLRMGLIPFFIIAVLDSQPLKALVLFAVAGITDALDGFLARVFGQVSLLGTYLDPLADKLLLISAYVMLAIPGVMPGIQVPMWVTVLVIARDMLILMLALVLYLAAGVTRFPPTRLSKVNTAVQIAGVLLVLLSGLGRGLDALAMGCIYLVGGLTILSGLDYVYRAHRMSEQGVAGAAGEAGGRAPGL